MRLQSITVQNFLGARDVSLAFSSPAVLVAAANGQGKSSLIEGVRLALTGDTDRLGLKKDIGQVISDGAKAGNIEVLSAAGDMNAQSSYSLPSGEWKGAFASPALKYVLEPALFAGLKQDERRSLLFALTGAAVSREVVAERLAKRGVRAQIVEAVLPMLRAGFPEACKEAKSKATEAKGAWRAITGETYGEKKAETWKAPAVKFDQETYDLEASKAVECDADLASAREALGRLKGQREAAKHQEDKVATLRATAASYATVSEQLKSAEVALKEAEDLAEKAYFQHNDLTSKAQPPAAKKSAPKAGTKLDCPHCEGTVFLVDGALKAALPEPTAPPPAIDAAMQRQIADARIALDEAQTKSKAAKAARDILKQQLAGADQAASTLRTLDASVGPVPTAEEISEAETLVTRLSESASGLRQSMTEMQAQKRAADAASEKTAAAQRHHADQCAWSLCGDALAPDGIPGEILAEALGPVTETLQAHASASGWPAVTIDAEMVVRYGGRLLTLCSESERWRADAMIAAMIAKLSGLRMLMLDRLDVLDIPGRSACIEWLDHVLASGELESALVAGTFKSLPSGLPDTITPVWLERGRVQQPMRAAA